jgi:hypothetical protein
VAVVFAFETGAFILKHLTDCKLGARIILYKQYLFPVYFKRSFLRDVAALSGGAAMLLLQVFLTPTCFIGNKIYLCPEFPFYAH